MTGMLFQIVVSGIPLTDAAPGTFRVRRLWTRRSCSFRPTPEAGDITLRV